MKYLLVFAGGGLGATLRYWTQGLVHDRFGASFPYGTLTVNIVGCLIIGLLMTALEEHFLASPALRLFLTIGILGGFTTFSSFSYETLALIQDGEFLIALANVGFTVLLCLASTWVGLRVGRWI